MSPFFLQMKQSIFFLSVFIISCSSNSFQNINGIKTEDELSLTFKKSVSYLLPQTFAFNMPFTNVFFDKATQKEYITFGNDYATDSLYFFDLKNGGKPIQVTPLTNPTRKIKGAFVISLDSILVVPKNEPSIILLDGAGEIILSKSFEHLIQHSFFDLQKNSSIVFNPNLQKIFFEAEIFAWNIKEKNRFLAMKEYTLNTLNQPFIFSLSHIFTDSMSSENYTPNFYSRFVDTNECFFPLPKYYVNDTSLFILSAYSDSVYSINHTTGNQVIIPNKITSRHYKPLKSKPAPLVNEDDAYTMNYLSSRSTSYHLLKFQYYKPLNTYLISISSKALGFNDSGNPNKYSTDRGILMYDLNFDKIGEIKLEGKGLFKTYNSGIILRKTPDKESPSYDPRKIELEFYELSY